jgi:hypothetical protein
MEIINQDIFFETIKDFKLVDYTQTKGFLSIYDSIDGKVIYLVDSIENPQIACLCHIKKALGLKMLLTTGPCIRYPEYKSSLIKKFYQELPSLGFDMIEINSGLEYNFEYESGIRRAGFLRPVGNFSIPLSNWINLKDNLSYNSNWKRNLKKANEENLTFQVKDKITQEEALILSNFYVDFCKEKKIPHCLQESYLYRLLNSDNFSFATITDSKGLTSFIIFHHLDKHAGLYYAAKNKAAEQTGATFFMYDKLLNFLKDNGYDTFDMEKLLPSTHSTDSVFLFKNGIKGNHVLYNGEFSWYKKPIYRPLMYLVKKYIMKKLEI